MLIVGGEDDVGPLASVLRFDPATLQFTRTADLLTARAFARTPLPTDGGLRRAGPTLAASRVLHTVTPLVISGTALVFGGLDAGRNGLASAEIFE